MLCVSRNWNYKKIILNLNIDKDKKFMESFNLTRIQIIVLTLLFKRRKWHIWPVVDWSKNWKLWSIWLVVEYIGPKFENCGGFISPN